MGFQHENGHEAIRFSAGGVSGVAAVDGYLLRFTVSYYMAPWKEEFGAAPRTFHNFRGRADLGPNRVHLGFPQAEAAPSHHAPRISANYFDDVRPATTRQHDREDRRASAGGGFELRLRLSGERVGKEQGTEHDEVLFRFSQSDWVHVLGQMNYGNYLLCEIPIGIGQDDELREVWAAMTLARKLLYTGNFSSTVVESRKALETALKRFDLDGDVRSASQKYRGTAEDRTSMSKRERLLNLVNAAKHVTQLGAHPDTRHRVIDYSRREALLVFSVVAAAIAEMSDWAGR